MREADDVSNTDIWVAPTWAGIEYSGRWKVLHSMAQSIYSQVIIAAYHNVTTGDFSISVTSDLWNSVSGTATLEWMSWNGTKLDLSTPSSTAFDVGAINSTQIYATNLTRMLANHEIDSTDAVLKMSVAANGSLPNTNTTTTFTQENWFAASALKTAMLQDPGLTISHSQSNDTLKVTAEKAVAAWVWIDYPAGAVVTFSQNAFWLGKGESVEVEYKVKNDTTGGDWINGVSVRSMWDQTQP